MAKQKPKPSIDRVGRYRELLSETDIAALEDAIKKAPPTAIRFNPLKTDPQHTAEEFSEQKKWKLQPVPYCPDGFTLLESPFPPGRTLESRLGYFYIMDAASMLPVELFEPADTTEPLILDLTASPGGKTTHLASRFSDRGLILANDGTSSRIPALTSTLKTWGAANSAVINFPGEKIGQWFPDTFNYVLLDAPCSMENLHPGDKNKRAIKPPERGRLAGRQVQLLLSSLSACKPGGQVVYSTCTLAPEEDEGVLDTVLHLTGNAVTITEAAKRLGIEAPGLSDAFGQSYSIETKKAVRLWPNRMGTSGFFTAHLRKNDRLPQLVSGSPVQPMVTSNLIPLYNKEQDELRDYFTSICGCDLSRILEEQNLSLARFKQSVYTVPRRLESDFSGLPVNSCGLRLGDHTESGFEPSLEWVTRYGSRITNNLYPLTPDRLAHWCRGEDLPLESDGCIEKGTIVFITDSYGRIMGTGRVSSRGIKNLLPRHLALKS
jgi:16S rRNA (cytosine1407-C5)-methyltransferase